MDQASTTTHERGGFAWLLLLPSLLLAWPGPGAVLRDVFAATELTATGAALLASLPMGVFAVLKGSSYRPRFFTLWLPCLALAMFAQQVPGWEIHDTLEASRGQWMLILCAIATLAGATANVAVRETFMRGSMVVSLVLASWALVGESATPLGGMLGNTGELASAALFGAVLGARAIVRESGAWRIVGAAAAIAFAAQAAIAPSIANLIAFSIGTLACALLEPTRKSERIARLAVGLLPLLLLLVVKAPSAASESEASQPGDSVLGGVSVRVAITKSTFELINESPLLGVGPGQFAVEFPPYRDVDEISASSNRADSRYYTEVEHPHQDWLLVLSEYGFVAGGALLLFWILAGFQALVTFRKGEPIDSVIASGLVATLAGSFANAPLGMNPAAASLAFVAMGMLLSRRVASGSSLASRSALPGAVFVLLLMSVPRAWKALQHGRALASIGAEEEPSTATYADSLEAALTACPDSVVALSLGGRLESTRGGTFRIARELARRLRVAAASRRGAARSGATTRGSRRVR